MLEKKNCYHEYENMLVEGINAVCELIKSEQAVDKIFISSDSNKKRIGEIKDIAKKKGIPFVVCDKRKLDAMSQTKNHQGVVAQAAQKNYSSIDDIFEKAKKHGEKPLLVICDCIEDPRNLGSIIRSAESAGAHGIIIPKHRSAALSSVTAKASAGAISHMLICKTTNIVETIKDIKMRGVWVFGAEANGTTSLYNADFKDSAAIVIGSEGKGISRLVRENCDFIISIPMCGHVNSLNASNAAAVLLYEAVRQRIQK